MKREEPVVHERHSDSDDIDIPAFLRNRRTIKRSFHAPFCLNGKDLLAGLFIGIFCW